MACSCVIGLCDVLPIPCRRGRPPKWPKYMNVHPTKSAGAPTALSSIRQTHSTNNVQFSSSKTGEAISKTVVKGNIIYKRTETGEVIASVIKNGPKLTPTASAAASTNRGRPSSESRTLCIVGETNLPTDCPVNEANVEHILDKSIAATQSMRRTLVSLKDDLRRMGGGAVMSPSLKPIHLQHRINIAYKLARAFGDYRSTMSAISSDRSSEPAMCSQTGTALHVSSPTVCVSSVPVTCLSQHSTQVVTTSSQHIARCTAGTVLTQSCKVVTSVVSDDLLMSCEAEHD